MPGLFHTNITFLFAHEGRKLFPDEQEKQQSFPSQICTGSASEIWKWAENQHCSQVFHFILTPPMPWKYSGFVDNSPSPWISYSFSGPEQGSIYKSFQNSSWLWQNNTKTELLKIFHRGFLIYIGNLLFLMQPLPIFLLKISWRQGEENKKVMIKLKRLELMKCQSWEEVKLSKGRWERDGCRGKGEGERAKWVIPLHGDWSRKPHPSLPPELRNCEVDLLLTLLTLKPANRCWGEHWDGRVDTGREDQ